MDPISLLVRWDVTLVFAAVLAKQLGLPVPAAPILVAAGALAQEGTLRPQTVLLTAIAACLVADHGWYIAGRLRGRELLAGICRVSLSPDTCVRRTDDLIVRYGGTLLMVANFIPGVSAVAVPTAASMGLPYWRFLAFDTFGAIAWCAAYAGLGMIFSTEVQRALDGLASFGGWSMLVLGLAFAAYLGVKFAHRRRLRDLYRAVRISPGAMVVDELAAFELSPSETRGMTIVTFCTCPNEASAAFLAEQLLKAGHERVRVLTGGTDALAVLAR